jgi:acyl-[acyl-carrier-protein] desaturase
MSLTKEARVQSSRFEVIRSMDTFVGDNLNTLLKPVDESWQPNDFLPDMTSEGWIEQLQEFRRRAAEIPDDVMVVLVGDMITEEALPTYQTWLNRFDAVTDETGVSDNPWAQWSRGWTSEENRHGDLLNKYLYLSGRVDMHAVEVTTHYLIKHGFDPQTENDPYLGFIYTAFQERATKISHKNVGVLSMRAGDDSLHKICGLIAGDEARHERAYTLFMNKIFELDPTEAVQAFAKMMKKKITMPAILMYDGKVRDLFSKFSAVAQSIGVYTARDYANIIDHLVKAWKISAIRGLSGAAAEAQDYLCGLAARYQQLSNRIKFSGTEKFSWIFNREVALTPDGKK